MAKYPNNLLPYATNAITSTKRLIIVARGAVVQVHVPSVVGIARVGSSRPIAAVSARQITDRSFGRVINIRLHQFFLIGQPPSAAR